MAKDLKPGTKDSKTPAKKTDQKKRKGIKQFFRELIAELKKVSWPSRKDLITHSLVVIVFVLAFSVIIGLIDMGLTPLFKWLIS